MADTARPALAKVVVLTALAAGGGVFVASILASMHKSPGFGGLMTGIFAGLFGGLLVAVAGAWAGMRLANPTVPVPVDTALGDRLAAGLADVLAELETTRQDLYAQAIARSMWRIPLGVGAGALWWAWHQFSKDPDGAFGLLMDLGVGGMAGYFWAFSALSGRYVRLYKDRVLPRLAAGFGAISYRQAITPDLARLRAQHIFAEFDDQSCEDELFGTYRGLDISIMELSLHKGSGDDRKTVFEGLIAQVTLPRGVTGVTAVIADEGVAGTVRDWFARSGRDRVRVEDPEFEAAWQVYGTDQIGARALLTPAFMERFKQLAARPGFGKPLALADGNRLLLALPRWGASLFRTPEFGKPAANRETLTALHDGIAALLASVDTVIDLDQAARATAARQAGGSAASTSA